MEIDAVMWIFIGVIALIVFLIPFVRSFLPISREKGKSPLYKSRCGLRCDNISLSFPLARVAIYVEFLVIKSFKTVELNIAEIEKVKIIKNEDDNMSGIQIFHCNPKQPEKIMVWGISLAEVKEIFLKIL